MQEMNHTCPHCGAFLHAESSFCPQCCASVNYRTELKLPKKMRGRVALKTGITLLVIAGFLLGGYLCSRPQVYDGLGEVLYSDSDGDYQVLVANPRNRYEPIPEKHQSAELEEQYRFPSCLYINHVDSGANAGPMFLKKVDRITAEILQPADSISPMTCTEPAPHDYAPDAAMVSFVDYTAESGTTQLVWTIYMENGDIIHLRQDEYIEPIHTYDYYPADAPMDTLEELQTLVNEIAVTIEANAVVNVHLPAVTYEGSLVMESRPVNLYGSSDGQRRTTFTDTVRVASKESWITYIDGIDFVGNGSGVGVSASARLHLTNCTFTNWKTAVLAYGDTWVNIAESRFENNEIGFHFNSTGNTVSHTIYNDNQFLRNETGILLERVPTEVSMSFPGSLFSDNGVDIDNRCEQAIDISEAVFE